MKHLLQRSSFCKDILYIFKIYIAQMQRNMSVYALSWTSKWKFPSSLPSPDLPRVLVWRIYSARFCTLIKLQIHMTPEHIKACSVHLLPFRPQTVLKDSREGGGAGGGGGESPLRYADMFIPRLYLFQSPETSLAYHISSCTNLHLDTERHFKRCQQHQCFKTSPQLLARSLKRASCGKPQ